MFVVLVYFLTLRMSFFENFLLDDIVDFVNNTSRDKGRSCANEKWKRCNRISSDITLGLNYPTAGIYKDTKVRLTKITFL